jgi:hypothetical protein
MATKKKTTPAIDPAITAQAQAITKAKYGPEIDALGTLLTQAMNTYTESKGQALAGGNIIARAAAAQSKNLAPQFAAIEASANQPGGAPLGPAGQQAQTEAGATRETLMKMFGADQVNAQAGAQYQVGRAAKTRDQQVGQIQQQLSQLQGQAGDYAASQIDSMLTASQKAAYDAEQARLGRIHDTNVQKLKNTSATNVANIGATSREKVAASKGKGSGSGSVKSPFLAPTSQSAAQSGIDNTIQTINKLRGEGVTARTAAGYLLKGRDAYSQYPPTYTNPENGQTLKVDQQTGQVLNPDGTPFRQRRKSVSGSTLYGPPVTLKQVTLPAIPQAAVPIYVWAALDRILYSGAYSHSTAVKLHNAGIKVLDHPVVPDKDITGKGLQTVGEHGGTN